MKRERFLLAASLLLVRVSMQGQCAYPDSAITDHISNINFTAVGSPPQNVSAGPLEDAINKWAYGCAADYGYGYPTMTTGAYNANAGNLNILVIWEQGRSPDRCGKTDLYLDDNGQIIGATVYMWPQQADGADCTPTWTNLVAHEIGHVLGLNDVDNLSYCDGTIMGRYPTDITAEQCYAVNQTWYTPSEWATDEQQAVDDMYCQAYGCSPIVIDVTGDGYSFSGPQDAVRFDIDADGRLENVAWTARDSHVAFLALDRNRNRIIDDASELFGDHTPLPDGSTAANGFEALRQYDLNHDGEMNADDAVWPLLRLWIDMDHDGFSQLSEIFPASQILDSLNLTYEELGKSDRYGNRLRFKAKMKIATRDGKLRIANYYDVYLVPGAR